MTSDAGTWLNESLGGFLPIGGIALVCTVIATSWRTVMNWFNYARSRVVVTVTVDDILSSAVQGYVWRESSPSNFGGREYKGRYFYVRSLSRMRMVALETMSANGRVCWLNSHRWPSVKIPVWVCGLPQPDDQPGAFNAKPRSQQMTMTFVRGLLDADRLVSDALNWFNAENDARVADSRRSAAGRRRYFVRVVSGSGDRELVASSGGHPTADRITEHPGGYTAIDALPYRMLDVDINDVGPVVSERGCALSRLALCDDLQTIVDRVRHWRNDESWFLDRGIPWRIGFVLAGEPGTGKTSLVRAIAEDLDMPVFVYDLSTLRNDELLDAWVAMQQHTPCVALIEDMHAVFDGCVNQTKHQSLSFDCLLNAIDGIRRTDGVMLVVTTNRPETLDCALTRPGRAERMITIGPMTREQRRVIAERILSGFGESDEEQLVTSAVDATDGMVGASVQEHCVSIARTLRDRSTIEAHIR